MMEGSSSKETSQYSAANAGTHSMHPEFSQPLPPPPYSQQPGYPGPVLVGQGVAVTQQPGMILTQPGPGGPVTATLVGNTVVQTMVVQPVVGNMLSNMPSLVQCRTCNHQMVTRVEHTPSGRTHMAALLLCLFGCWPCIGLPYCMSSCQRAEHFCTNCGAFVGAF